MTETEEAVTHRGRSLDPDMCDKLGVGNDVLAEWQQGDVQLGHDESAPFAMDGYTLISMASTARQTKSIANDGRENLLA